MISVTKQAVTKERKEAKTEILLFVADVSLQQKKSIDQRDVLILRYTVDTAPMC